MTAPALAVGMALLAALLVRAQRRRLFRFGNLTSTRLAGFYRSPWEHNRAVARRPA